MPEHAGAHSHFGLAYIFDDDPTVGQTAAKMLSAESTVCGEGVETSYDLKTLRELGFDTAQGFLFARPMPVAQFMSSLLAPDARRNWLGLLPPASQLA